MLSREKYIWKKRKRGKAFVSSPHHYKHVGHETNVNIKMKKTSVKRGEEGGKVAVSAKANEQNSFRFTYIETRNGIHVLFLFAFPYFSLFLSALFSYALTFRYIYTYIIHVILTSPAQKQYFANLVFLLDFFHEVLAFFQLYFVVFFWFFFAFFVFYQISS